MNPLGMNAAQVGDKGVSLYHLLENAWLLPSLIKGCRDKIWENEYDSSQQDPMFTQGDPTLHPVVAVWHDLHLIERLTPDDNNTVKFGLTVAGLNMVKSMPLLEYEFSMMNQQLDKEFVTDPKKYKNLRGALANYSKLYLPEMHEWVASFVNESDDVLDFGGGDGAYLETAMLKATEGSGLLLDKAPGHAILSSSVADRVVINTTDFKQEDFFSGGEFDVIIVSEVLHVLSTQERADTVRKLSDMLCVGGRLLVMEQVPNVRLAWRMMDMTEHGKVLHVEEVIHEIAHELPDCGLFPFVDDVPTIAGTHYGIAFVKKEVSYDS